MTDKKILVVDDEDSIREVMVETLEDNGYAVSAASNGVDGLKILAEKDVDLIVLDLNMPRMDGYMFLERLRDRWEREGQRFIYPAVLVLTAVDLKSDLGLAQNLGAQKLMNKPFKSKDFLAAVEELLS